MSIQCVLFSRDKSPIKIEIESPAELPESVEMWLLPVAVVVRIADLEDFGKRAELFKNRGKKDERKGLSKYLLGQGDCIPYIDANVGDPGRVKQAVTSFLKKAEKASEKGIYLLGVRNDLFPAVWKPALTEDAFFKEVSRGKGLAAFLLSQGDKSKLTDYFWGNTEAYYEVRQLIRLASTKICPVLILGDAGTGKDVVAWAIHDQGQKMEQRKIPFIKVNCAAISGGLFELEVFGYAPNAFRGALFNGKAGKWEEANGGTLFLDEISDLRLDNQEKVLRTLQQGVIWRVGSSTESEVSARVIASSNRDLYGMVQKGKFNEDLYYLLRQFLIRTPDLREDPQNLEVFAQKLWREITNSDARLPKEIVDDLCNHSWPGNVRELRSVLSSLYNFFGASGLKREQLNAVFQHFGLAAGYGQRMHEAGEPALLQMECLRKICHADEAIRACEQELKPLAAELPLKDTAWASLTRMRVEMQALMRNRLYFGNQETYQAMVRVEENFGKLLELPKKDMPELSSFWRKTLEPEIRQAGSLLFTEHQKLLGLMGSSV
jgi:DNA-binding NtrC family response regulator